MAQPIPCDICETTTADFLITVTSNGDVIGVGIECLGAWAEALTSAYEAARAADPANNPATDGMPAPKPKRKPRKPSVAEQAMADTQAEWEASGRSDASSDYVAGSEQPEEVEALTDGTP